MYLAVGRVPPDPSVRVAAAAALGIALPDFVRRATGPLPRILLSAAEVDGVERAAAALRALGFGVVTLAPEEVPDDRRRLVARTARFEPDGLVVGDSLGAATQVPWSSVGLVQRAIRSRVSVEITTETRKELSLSRSVLTGGLINRKTVEEKQTTRTEAREHFLVVHRGDGAPDVVLGESRLDFRFLGAEKQMVGFANLERTTRWLRDRLPTVPFEDRLSRPGLLTSLSAWPGDATDLGLELVRRCVRAGAF